jgi:osmotically-inducible protein OsmY
MSLYHRIISFRGNVSALVANMRKISRDVFYKMLVQSTIVLRSEWHEHCATNLYARKLTGKKDDAQIARHVKRELSWDRRTRGSRLEVDVTDGIVMLSGLVPNHAILVAAQDAAHGVIGVLGVANEIVVKARRPYSDESIAHAVRQALTWDARVPGEHITTTVTDGWVKLEGSVEILSERFDAEWAVENIDGVKGVINEIKAETPSADASELQSKIETALERRADREAERLRIRVDDGEVNLTGRVHSWQERKAVVGSISHAPGVKTINDNLRIDPYF